MAHALDDVKHHKLFYRTMYRRMVRALFFSLLLMAVLSLLIFYLKVREPKPAYYATNSAGFITPLRELPGPNMSLQAILKPDPPEEYQKKELTIDGGS